MANIERLESSFRSAPHALVPYLDPNLLAIDFHYFETKVIGVFTDGILILFRILLINLFKIWLLIICLRAHIQRRYLMDFNFVIGH